MRVVTLIGADGFVGKGFNRLLSRKTNINLICINRHNYHKKSGNHSDIVIDAAGSSAKFIAQNKPFDDFQKSAYHCLNVLKDYPSKKHIHISSVDIYNSMDNQDKTKESQKITLNDLSNYGFHKKISEEIVQHYSNDWLIFRLAGMVGHGIKKGPIYDILNGMPLYIHPESRYHFLSTEEVAKIVWSIIELELSKEIINVAGKGNISLKEISELARIELNLKHIKKNSLPRVLNINVNKVLKYYNIPKSKDVIAEFISSTELL
jgi:nucleoside-diphosphate-sugar epimerase